jgi:hypothetical protein
MARWKNNEDAGDLRAMHDADASAEEPKVEKVYDVHPFEAAGLGRAPYRVVGVTEGERGPRRSTDPKTGITTEVGAPGQLLSVCAFCSQPIAEVWIVADAGGSRFTVGCKCVEKTDAKLASDPAALNAAKALRRKARKRAAEAREERARRLLDDEAVRDALRATKAGRGDALGYVDFCLVQGKAGAAGKTRCFRLIEKAAKSVGVEF